MSTSARKRKAASPGKHVAGLRRDVQQAIERVCPDGIVEMSFNSDESYFYGVHPKLTRAFHRIQNALLLREREAEGGPIWWDESDPEEDPPDHIEHSRSYHIFFVSPNGAAFSFEAETNDFVEPDFTEADGEEYPPVSRIAGEGKTGWVVAVSLLAPFAVIEIGDVTTFEDGATAEPVIESYAETVDGERIDAEQHFRKVNGAEAYKTLLKLRAKIGGILKKYGITVLAAEEWRKPVPWLRAGEESLIGIEGMPIRVLNAFFFEEL